MTFGDISFSISITSKVHTKLSLYQENNYMLSLGKHFLSCILSEGQKIAMANGKD